MESTAVIIDDDLILDVETGVIGSKKHTREEVFPVDDLMLKIDKLEDAINNLESSLDPRTTSGLSQPNREGIYEKTGLITNIVIGVVIALVFILLLM